MKKTFRQSSVSITSRTSTEGDSSTSQTPGDIPRERRHHLDIQTVNDDKIQIWRPDKDLQTLNFNYPFR